MKRIKASIWEDLDVVPEGEWVYVPGGLDVEVIPPGPRPRAARLTVPVTATAAASLSPRPGEILEARVKGKTVELVRRRKSRRPKGARSH